jgi:hypothetical protein
MITKLIAALIGTVAAVIIGAGTAHADCDCDQDGGNCWCMN